MWIKIEDDYYNEDSIAFVRRLKKEKNGMAFVVNLKSSYDLSGHGKCTIFLPLLEGFKVIGQIEASIEERRRVGEDLHKVR